MRYRWADKSDLCTGRDIKRLSGIVATVDEGSCGNLGTSANRSMRALKKPKDSFLGSSAGRLTSIEGRMLPRY